MKIAILTIFPQIFEGFLRSSLIDKAIKKGVIEVEVVDLRAFADPPHYKVDDVPYGGGPGMVMKPEPLYHAIRETKKKLPHAPVILLSASGELFRQSKAGALARENEIIFVCGRYEGVDQRVIELLVDTEISIGDYVLMGGEVPAMVVMEACLRLREGVIGNMESLALESFAEGELLESPQYTRPPEFKGLKVPEILLSGDHRKIDAWKREESVKLTRLKRPDLLKK